MIERKNIESLAAFRTFQMKQFAVNLAYFLVRRDKSIHGVAAQGYDNGRVYYFQLTPQIRICADFDFLRERVAILRRTAFDDIGDKNPLPFQSDTSEHLIQKFPGGADEGKPLFVFIRPRPFADKHNFT